MLPGTHTPPTHHCPHYHYPHPAAINPNGDHATAPATWGSDPLVVGAPLPPTVTAVTGGVGRLTIEWSAPALNADLDVTYTLAIYDVTPGNRSPVDVPLEDVPLTASPKVVTQLVAGTKRVQITATNANAGPGRYLTAVKSALADEADVTLATAPGIAASEGLAGSTLGANISVTVPSQMSTAVLNKFLIQASGVLPVVWDGNPALAATPDGQHCLPFMHR